LLGDIRDTFGNLTEMPSAVMADALVEIEGHPWAEMGKARKPLTQNRLARMLKSTKQDRPGRQEAQRLQACVV